MNKIFIGMLISLLASLTVACFAQDEIIDKKNISKILSKANALSEMNVLIWLNPESVNLQIQQLEKNKKEHPNKKFPLWGIVYVAKDNIDTNFMPTSGGTPALKNKTPEKSAPVIEKLKNAGAILLGKTNMHELAFGITSNNAAFGPVRNAYNRDYIAGGSSGGTAAAIAAGIVEVGLGTDTGGSMRIPAALNGIYGFRPSTGRYEQAGVIPLSHTRDTVGVMAQNMELLVKFDQVLSGDKKMPKIHLNKLRIGVPHEYFHENLHPDVAKELTKLIALLKTKDVEIVRADIKDIGRLNNITSFPIVLYETAHDFPAYLENRGQVDFETLRAMIASPDVKGALMSITGAGAVPEKVYRAALEKHRPALQKAYEVYFATHQLDAMLVMTTPRPAAKIGEDETIMLNGEAVPTFATFIRNTDPTSTAGLAALTIPVGLSSKGLPIGAEIVGLENTDAYLLQLGVAVEKIIEKLPAPK